MSEIKSTREWFAASGQIPAGMQPNSRQAAFYTGMQLEEVAEKLEAIFGPGDYAQALIGALQATGEMFKKGAYDEHVYEALRARTHAMLDADCDIIWVSIGAAAAQGADIEKAYAEVDRANWDKFPGGVVTRDPATGKVIKPHGWIGPKLLQFTHPTLRGL